MSAILPAPTLTTLTTTTTTTTPPPPVPAVPPAPPAPTPTLPALQGQLAHNNDNRITQLVIPQITNNKLYEHFFFNGTEFHDKNNPEMLLLPAGCLGSTFTFP
ncbi:hypothetical protein C1645_731961 [Glomus cerebriforme]|uniref:Uncharacterized protein n=1 Tax=Glomus cerebriforme TaxID=658196 RepID=A0A397TSK6_9GLOM|nr:hypothetical protein C1645_731961 [Glomus cerebriforme]